MAGIEKQLKQVDGDLHAALMLVPNMSHPDAPVSTDPAGNVVSRNGASRGNSTSNRLIM